MNTVLETQQQLSVPSELAQTPPPLSSSVETLPSTVTDKLSKCAQLKSEGNALFKQEQWKKAIKKYHHSLMYAKGVTDRPDKLMGMTIPTLQFSKPNKEQERAAEELLVSGHNNIAACLIKLNDWEKAVGHTVKVLEMRPENVKGLFRQGLCYLNIGRLDQAQELLRKALTFDPKDVNIKKQLQIVEQKQLEQAKTLQTMYRAMFAQTI